MVHTDDVLFLCKTQKELKRLYVDFINFLQSVALHPNLAKVQEGRFASGVLDYCGYRFAGGYVTISDHKIIDFKTGIALFCAAYNAYRKPFIERAFIKRINQKIAGFGHYYKWGAVNNIFEKLDSFIRAQIRLVYKRLHLPCPSNAYLETLGLRSLLQLKLGTCQGIITLKSYQSANDKKRTTNPTDSKDLNNVYLGFLEKLVHQNTEIITQLKTLNKNTVELQKLLIL